HQTTTVRSHATLRSRVDIPACLFAFLAILHYSSFTQCQPLSAFARFPYTTLFRSARCAQRGGRAARNGRSARNPRADGATRRGADRKSTRLNSSHVKSSYAVFCLKKKREKKEKYDD